jgi:hypothetical protein
LLLIAATSRCRSLVEPALRISCGIGGRDDRIVTGTTGSAADLGFAAGSIPWQGDCTLGCGWDSPVGPVDRGGLALMRSNAE